MPHLHITNLRQRLGFPVATAVTSGASVGDEGAPLCALPRAALGFQHFSGVLCLIVSVEEAGKLSLVFCTAGRV